MNKRTHITQGHQTTLQKLLETGPLRLVLAGLYFLLGVKRAEVDAPEIMSYTPCYKLNRKYRRVAIARRRDRRGKINTKNLTHLKAFMPEGISQTQFLERCTKLSYMGRFRVYNFQYHRSEFRRGGAMKRRFRAPLVRAINLGPCGLSAAHLGPD